MSEIKEALRKSLHERYEKGSYALEKQRVKDAMDSISRLRSLNGDQERMKLLRGWERQLEGYAGWLDSEGQKDLMEQIWRQNQTTLLR